MATLINRKRQLVIIGAVILLFILGIYILHLISEQSYEYDIAGTLLIEAEIINVYISQNLSGTFAGSLDIVENGIQKAIFIHKETKLYNNKKKSIKITALAAGQRINATVSTDVIYEPVETYIQCYEMVIL
jgi:hypothetical protein